MGSFSDLETRKLDTLHIDTGRSTGEKIFVEIYGREIEITRKNIDSYMRIVLVMQRYFYQILSVVSEPKFELYIFNYFF